MIIGYSMILNIPPDMHLAGCDTSVCAFYVSHKDIRCEILASDHIRRQGSSRSFQSLIIVLPLYSAIRAQAPHAHAQQMMKQDRGPTPTYPNTFSN